MSRRRLKNHQLPQVFTLDPEQIQDTIQKSKWALEVIKKWTKVRPIKDLTKMILVFRIIPRTWERLEMNQLKVVEAEPQIFLYTKTIKVTNILGWDIK